MPAADTGQNPSPDEEVEIRFRGKCRMLQESASSQLFGASQGCVMKKFTRIALIAAGFLTAAMLSGCGSATNAPTPPPPPPAISISFNGGNSRTMSQGQSVTLTVTVSNDSSGKGVTWSLSGLGALSNLSGTSVQYDAPASVASSVSAMVTATSVADTTKFATATITINPPPLAISTTTLPDGMVGTPYSQDIQATGGVVPFTWVVGAGTLLPHNLNLDNSTTSTVTISGTPDTQQPAVQFTIQVTDSANQSATQSYTVNINNPPALTIATSSVPPGTINVA